MSDAIKKLYDYLAKSPSVIYPEDVLAYLSAIEAENAKLRGLMADLLPFAYIGMEDACPTSGCFLFEECRYSISPDCDVEERMLERLREAGIEANV